jgi:hypothetical protein
VDEDRLRDKLQNRELFLSLAEAQVVLDLWRSEYNQQRPNGSLGCPPPDTFAAHLIARPARGIPGQDRQLNLRSGLRPLTPIQLAK